MKKRLISFFLAAAISAASVTALVSASDTEMEDTQYTEKEWETEMVSTEEPELDTEVPKEGETTQKDGFMVQTRTSHGQIILSSSKDVYEEMEVVEFFVIPDEGYEVYKVSAESLGEAVEMQSFDEESYRFIMPAGDVFIEADLILEQESPDMAAEQELSDMGNELIQEPEETEPIPPDDFDFTVISEENLDLITAETPEAEEFLEEIEEGQVIALAPVENLTIRSAAMVMSTAENEMISLAAGTSPFTVNLGGYLNMDEVWVNSGTATHHMGTAYREIVYTDDEGVSHTAPVYCMNPTKNGPMDPSMTIKEEAIKILSNSKIKKILYYGYGGPGDISGTYDPTCSHCDWSKGENRYVLTHMALSKVYSNDVAGATAAECEHVGLNRWISKLTSMIFPDMKELKFYGKDSNGDTVSTKDMVGNLTYYKVVPDSLSWCGMKNGVQVSAIYKLTSSIEKNGIKFSCKSSDIWTMGYWTSEADYSTRGKENPRILGKGKSVTLYKGARIRFAFPHTITSKQKMAFTSILKPVEYIAINASIQTNQSNMQDLGTYFYEGDREKLSLTFQASPTGTVILKKVADQDPDIKIEGAGYRLMAAEDIVSNGTTVLKKNEKLAGGHTDKNGEITFSYVPVGKYYLIEVNTTAGSEAEKYLMDTSKHTVTVVKNTSKTVTVQEIPDLSGKVSIHKVIGGTELNLTGAEFTLYAWSKKSQKYTNGVKLQYNTKTKRYESEVVRYTSDNQGKFKVKETKNPKGFTGTFSKTFVLTKLGQEELFKYTVENDLSSRRVEIIKLDSVTRENLPDAEFTLYAWNNIKKAYESIGQLLSYDAENERYYSEELIITDLNTGKFKVTETRVPDGYTGIFEMEMDLNDTDADLQLIAENTPKDPVYGKISIKKTDSSTGSILPDAEFTVYQYNTVTGQYEDTLGEKSKLFFDEESQLYFSHKLRIDRSNDGKFRVSETKPPKGYIGSWQKDFILTEEQPQPAPFEVQNDLDRPPTGEITVIKKIRESDILWDHGNPIFSFAVEGKDTNGNKRKYENYVRFSPGGYEVDSSGYAVLQITFHNVPIGEYQVYEKPVLYYYLEKVTANTANVSVVKGAAPAYGIAPRSIAYGTAKLTSSAKKATVTFVNKKSRYDHLIHNDVVKNRIPIAFE